MSWDVGKFNDTKNANPRSLYVDASQMGDRINICGTDDTDVIMRLEREDAERLRLLLDSAFEYLGWKK